MILSFLANKIVLTILAALVVTPTIVYGGFKANDYRQTQIIVQEAKQLSSGGKYQEAINKLTEADNKWSFGGVKKEVESLKEENKTLVQGSVNYDLGKELFDKDKYKDALDVLKKVDSRNINYPSARSLIELAEKKVSDVPKGDVAGVKTQAKQVVQVSTPVLPTPTPTPEPQVVPQATNPPVQHSDSYCKNEAALQVVKLEEGLDKVTHEQSPWLYSYEAYLKQFPNAEIGQEAWQQLAQSTFKSYQQAAVKDAQKLYLQVYNQCLGN